MPKAIFIVEYDENEVSPQYIADDILESIEDGILSVHLVEIEED